MTSMQFYLSTARNFLLLTMVFALLFAGKPQIMPTPFGEYDMDTLQSEQKAYLDSIYLDSLQRIESKLKVLGDSIIFSDVEDNRVAAVREFIPGLVKALQIPGSFTYPFDSLKFMKSHTPADSSFRLFNWVLEFDDEGLRYYGAILKNTDDFTLYPLNDGRANMEQKPTDAIHDHRNWRGALYYDMIQTESRGQTYYTLLGWDRQSERTQVKLLDVLTFDEEGKPQFGAPIFNLRKGDQQRPDFQTQHRVFFEYSRDAVMTLDVADGLEIIIFDMLVAAGGSPTQPEMVPDGSYSSFVFKQGKWYQIHHPFDVLEEFRSD